jgi:DnaJ-class molecular chaperone
MENYYKILEITQDANDKEINEAYKIKIKKYNKLPFLDEKNIIEIKTLKKSKFILLDKELRNLYDKLLSKKKLENEVKTLEKKFDNSLIANRIFNMPRIPNNNNYNI